MIALGVYVNALFFLVYIFIKYEKEWYPRALILIWAIANVIYTYFLFTSIGVNNPYLDFHGFHIPIFYLILLAIIVLVLPRFGNYLKKTRLLILFCIVASITIFNSQEAIIALIQYNPMSMMNVVALFSVITPFIICVLAASTVFIYHESSLASVLFNFDLSHIKKHLKPVLSCIIIVLILVILRNAILERRLIYFTIITPTKSFVISTIIFLFYYVMIKHVTFFGFAKKILDSIFNDEDTSNWEIPLFAALYTGFHYYFPLIQLPFTFLISCVFAYLYLRTRSLVYGVIINTLFLMFVR
jgi:hypothetical protein